MVFQLPILYDDLTIQENIGMPLLLMKHSIGEITKKVEEMCDFFDIPTKFLRHKARGLDVAERQKVSLAHTFISDKNVYLLDEPLSNLDPRNRVEIRSKIKRYQNEAKKTIIYVTHDQTEAMSLAQKIAVMRLGVILHYEQTEIVYDYPQNRFVGWFLGNPGMNFIEGVQWDIINKTLQVNHLHLRFDVVNTEVQSRREVVMGIRPENISVITQPKEGFFEAQCDFIEPIGNRIIIHLISNGLKIKAKIERIKEIRKESKVWFQLPPDHILLFDPETGDKIYPITQPMA
jgi:ABC-type sugar transport system ATPase subunit